MTQSIKAALYWKRMDADIKEYVARCRTCATSKKHHQGYGQIPEKTVHLKPWSEIVIDSIGPLGKGKWRAISIMDTTTRLLELVVQEDPSSAEAARIIDQVCSNRYPRPQRCIFDGGSEFKLEFRELLESYGVQAVPTTACSPQANSTIERVHRTINDKLRTETIEMLADWENCLSSVAYAIRASHHTMIGCSPAQDAFNRDMVFDIPYVADWEAQQLAKQAQVAKATARENAGRNAHEYAPGDLVMVSRNDPPSSKARSDVRRALRGGRCTQQRHSRGKQEALPRDDPHATTPPCQFGDGRLCREGQSVRGPPHWTERKVPYMEPWYEGLVVTSMGPGVEGVARRPRIEASICAQ